MEIAAEGIHSKIIYAILGYKLRKFLINIVLSDLFHRKRVGGTPCTFELHGKFITIKQNKILRKQAP
jgi:hypothetical protein